MPLAALFVQCQHERSTYRTAGITVSPACVELIRRAFAGDQAAWALVQHLFVPLMRAWIGVQQHVEPDDVLQDALFAFARWAPANAELATGADLGRALAFLRQCTKTALLTQLRKQKQPAYCSLDAVPIANPTDAVAAAERRLIIRERIAHLLTTTEEQIVFQELLVDGRKPHELFARHTDLFGSIASLRVTIQRVLRRLRKDADLRDLC